MKLSRWPCVNMKLICVETCQLMDMLTKRLYLPQNLVWVASKFESSRPSSGVCRGKCPGLGLRTQDRVVDGSRPTEKYRETLFLTVAVTRSDPHKSGPRDLKLPVVHLCSALSLCGLPGLDSAQAGSAHIKIGSETCVSDVETRSAGSRQATDWVGRLID